MWNLQLLKHLTQNSKLTLISKGLQARSSQNCNWYRRHSFCFMPTPHSSNTYLRLLSIKHSSKYIHLCKQCRCLSNRADDEEFKRLAERFKDDPHTRSWLSEMQDDFENPEGTANEGIVFDESSSDSDSSDSDGSSSDSDNEKESNIKDPNLRTKDGNTPSGTDQPREASTSSSSIKEMPKIVEKSEYIITQDDVVYDYEELDENIVEAEVPPDEVYIPISLERGTTGVYDIAELVELLEYENACDICAIAIPEENQYVDHMVIVTAKSIRHCKAIAASVRWCFKRKSGESDPQSVVIEGLDSNDWLAMDLGNIALHIFMPETRMKFDIESLWTVGHEFDDNAQKEEIVEKDPFAAYLKDFGITPETDQMQIRQTNSTSPEKSATEPSITTSKNKSILNSINLQKKTPQFLGMENIAGWHSGTNSDKT